MQTALSLFERLLIERLPDGETTPALPSPAVARLQILLDQHGISPGVIDGFDGQNVRKAVMAFEAMYGLEVDGNLDAEVLGLLETGTQVIGTYQVTVEDHAALVPSIPSDYAEKAVMQFLGYESVPEAIAKRFHMDVDFLKALNPAAGFLAGETVFIVITGTNQVGLASQIVADKTLRQVRAYDATGRLLAAYPATIGSEDNPSPTGVYTVEQVTAMPDYTYNPAINFQQGDNTEVLTIPPGPNGPVGSIWIALSKPTYGIHGTPEPAMIDKTGSHGCIRLTNWDAEELAALVGPGVTVTFL
jgi:lipoprotein-anchoring transpeptidase ErfK/SrfK